MSKVLEVLNRDNWIQGIAAKDILGRYIDPQDFHACKFCLYGAICRAYGDDQLPKLRAMEGHLGTGIGSWNDRLERTWEDVEAVIKELGI